MKASKDYKFQNIIFDLDGTLIDSSRGILSSLDQVCIKNNIEIQRPIPNKVIGPPVRELMLELTGTKDEKIIDSLVKCFKSEYDSNGYKYTAPFKGINNILSSLYEDGLDLYIATNKRKNPTRKIIDMLAWSDFFKEVYCIDSFSDIDTKGELLSHMVRKFNLKNCVYVGDHMGDLFAANAAKLPYIMVNWGFGGSMDDFHGCMARHQGELIDKLKGVGMR